MSVKGEPMKVNMDKYIELFCIAENIQDKMSNEEYDLFLEQAGYSDPWEVIDDLINDILNLSEESSELEPNEEEERYQIMEETMIQEPNEEG